MRPIQPRLSRSKSGTPSLLVASEGSAVTDLEVVRLDVPKESEVDVPKSRKADDPSRLQNDSNFKIRPSNKHAWRALDVTLDPFDDPLH